MGEVPIDRGWAWMVVLGAHLVFFFLIGGFKSLGIFFVEFRAIYGGSRAVTALLMGLVSGGMSLLSPFSTILGSKHSMRCVAMVGAILCVTGTFLSFFATSLTYLILSFGLLMGIGYGLLFSPTMVMVNTYFDKRRSLASGLALAGGSMGTLLIPQLLAVLIEAFAAKGALLIYSGLMMHMIFGTYLLRPTTFYKRSKSDEKKPKKIKFQFWKKGASMEESPTPADTKKSHSGEKDRGLICDELLVNNSATRIRSDSIKSESDVKKLEPDWKTEPPRMSRGRNSTDQLSNTDVTEVSDIKTISRNFESGNTLDYSLPFYTSGGSLYFMPSQQTKCSSNGSLNFTPNHASTPYKPTTEKIEESNRTRKCCEDYCDCCSPCCGSSALFDWSLFGNVLFVSYVVGICSGNCGYVNTFLFIPPLAKDIGLDQHKQALLVSIAGGCDLFGRIFLGWFADLGYIKRHYLMSVLIGTLSVVTVICINMPGFWSYVVLATAIGIFGGGYICLFPVVLSDYIGTAKMPQGFGLTVMFMGLTNMGVPALLGAVRDAYGSYMPVFMFLASMMALCAITFGLESCFRRQEERRRGVRSQHLEWDDEMFVTEPHEARDT